MDTSFFTTKEVGKGTGQGLAICRDVVVDKHGGKIFIEPGQDMGTVFVVRIPIDAQGRKSAALHGGTLRLQSELGVGTNVTVSLPHGIVM